MNLFADAIALYRIIRSFDDYSSLQADIDAVSNCLAGKYLTLNPSKCCHLFTSRKRIRSISPPSLTLNGHKLTRVTNYKYLGVLINSDLMWSTHISKVCNKTRKLIDLFYRTFYKHSSSETMLKLYCTFIRPHLEYAAAAWDPFLKKDIDLLEDVQKFALKVCIKSWNRNYEELQSMTHLSSLQSRRQKFKLCHIFNIINNFTFFPEAPIQRRVLPYSSRSVHNQH